MFVKEETRSLARVVCIDDLKPIQKADRLEIAVVGGWECVVEKGLYRIGDKAVYFEIDSAIALDNPIWCGFDKRYLTVKKDEDGQEYAVIKTLRLRGALSQGLLLTPERLVGTKAEGSAIGANITEALGILKYVSPEEAKLYAVMPGANGERGTNKLIWKLRAWLVKGIIADGLLPWPHGHVKSDEERVQSCAKMYAEMVQQETDCEITIKFDGESATFYTDLETGKIGPAQRNYALRTEDVLYTRKESFRVYLADWVRFIARRIRGGACDRPVWKKGFMASSIPLVNYFNRCGIAARIEEFNANPPFDFAKGKVLAIQGEMIGPNFNHNREGVEQDMFFIYRAYLNGSLLCTPEQTRLIARELALNYIPVVAVSMPLPPDMKKLLILADGPAWYNRQGKREGIVVKDNHSSRSFKVISNAWLEKKGKEEAAEEAAQTQVNDGIAATA